MSLTTLLLILIGELLILYVLSQKISKSLYVLFFLLTRSRPVSVALLSFILLPGTVIHELAHLIVAEVLRVKTEKLSFTPEFNPDHDSKTGIKVGSLEITKTDPVRRYLIGFAPVFVGTAVLVLLTTVSFQLIPEIVDIRLRIAAGLLSAYLVFAFSNSMFSSRKDLEGFAVFVPIIAIIIGGLYFLGIRISLTSERLDFVTNATQQLSLILGGVLAINLASLLLARGALRAWEKVTGKKLHFS